MNLDRIKHRRMPFLNKIEERKKKPPEGYRAITGPEAVRRARPLVDAVLQGTVPLDDATKDVIALVADDQYKKFRRMSRG